MKKYVLLLMLSLLGLSACGVKGDLYIPAQNKQPSETQPPSSNLNPANIAKATKI
ncbi:putative lipoprotein [Nicoletella semolina]|uniref:Putative lipoprotein n=1 Tax=Nicoletella semolina TaxID=271160 RepID=A0A4R2NBP2_9PAST|nr:lipoprotein [Nicoletella semolina]TCP18490.1 putative lipoprotein [Nicoletella semolina]